MDAYCAVDAKNVLGEGCVWCEREGALYWVDIHGRKLQRHTPSKPETRVWELPERLGSFALREQGGVLGAFENGIALYDPESGSFQRTAEPEKDLPINRFNDGRADRQGRFWCGTMNDKNYEARSGALYRIDRDGSCHRIFDGIGVPNSICFAPEGDVMYFADSLDRTIMAFDLDRESGELSNRRLLVQVEGGVPDGSTVDAEGFLWNAQWGAWRVVRYAPDGSIDRIVELPAQLTTCCAFGGDDLRTLYVTTASESLSSEQLEGQPQAGGLFAIDVDVRGLLEPRFAG